VLCYCLLEIRPLHHTGQLGLDWMSLILEYLSDLSVYQVLSAELTMQQLLVCFVLYISERERGGAYLTVTSTSTTGAFLGGIV
jgi:hypothetical protein